MSQTNELMATLETGKGKIRLTLFADRAPLTVGNFINLALRGYYDGLKFHRVIEKFMIQGGCPQGSGFGGPGYTFPDEFDTELRHSKPGILSMANAGPDTNGSQFFITHVPTQWLDGKHTVFGEVVAAEDQDTVNMIQAGDRIRAVTVEGDYEGLLASIQSHLDNWNCILDSRFPDLK